MQGSRRSVIYRALGGVPYAGLQDEFRRMPGYRRSAVCRATGEVAFVGLQTNLSSESVQLEFFQANSKLAWRS